MKIDLTEEEVEFLLRVCTRAEMMAYKGTMRHSSNMMERDRSKIQMLINKLSEKKCENQ